MGDRCRAGRGYDLPVLSDPPDPDESIGDVVEREPVGGGSRRGRGGSGLRRHHGGMVKGRSRDRPSCIYDGVSDAGEASAKEWMKAVNAGLT